MSSMDQVPHAVPQGVPPLGEASARAASPKPRLSGSVLVVEDDADIRTMTATILRVAGATVQESSSASDAVRWLDLQSFDAIVLDWNLAGEKGSVLLENLSERFPCLLRRTAVVTGDLMSIPGKHEAERFGCPVLAKPFRPRQLLETVSQILAIKD